MCGLQRIWQPLDGQRWEKGKSSRCPCGFVHQKVDDFYLLAAAECAGGDLAEIFQPYTAIETNLEVDDREQDDNPQGKANETDETTVWGILAGK
jgi:hypothetical protein